MIMPHKSNVGIGPAVDRESRVPRPTARKRSIDCFDFENSQTARFKQLLWKEKCTSVCEEASIPGSWVTVTDYCAPRYL